MNSMDTSGMKVCHWRFQTIFAYILFAIIHFDVFTISVNIAFGKPAYQSSTDNPQDKCAAGGAVDGSLANNWGGGDRCSHTLNDQGPVSI